MADEDLIRRAKLLLPGPNCPGRVLATESLAEALGASERDVRAALTAEFQRLGSPVRFGSGTESAGGPPVKGWRRV